MLERLKNRNMNLFIILSYLKEAKEELDKTIEEIKKNKDYDFGEFAVAMSYLYQHLNTPWNLRDVTTQEAEEC
jgi:hypothetical protein